MKLLQSQLPHIKESLFCNRLPEQVRTDVWEALRGEILWPVILNLFCFDRPDCGISFTATSRFNIQDCLKFIFLWLKSCFAYSLSTLIRVFEIVDVRILQKVCIVFWAAKIVSTIFFFTPLFRNNFYSPGLCLSSNEVRKVEKRNANCHKKCAYFHS